MRRVSKRYLIIDGYNYINADSALKSQMQGSLESARIALNQMLSEYASYSGEIGIVVYDATKSNAIISRSEMEGGIEVVFTKKNETADAYIERLVYELAKDKANFIRVVTMDWAEQLAVFSQGGVRVSASEWRREIASMKRGIGAYSERNSKGHDRQLGTNLDEQTLKKLNSLLTNHLKD